MLFVLVVLLLFLLVCVLWRLRYPKNVNSPAISEVFPLFLSQSPFLHTPYLLFVLFASLLLSLVMFVHLLLMLLLHHHHLIIIIILLISPFLP